MGMAWAKSNENLGLQLQFTNERARIAAMIETYKRYNNYSKLLI